MHGLSSIKPWGFNQPLAASRKTAVPKSPPAGNLKLDRPRPKPAAALFVAITFSISLFFRITPAIACFWDYDTLRDERRGLPGIAEVLAGQWERHSQFFYKSRVEKMRAKIAADPNDLAAYDNLAVALEKIGERDEGIAVLVRKDRLAPNQYTTFANLGTIYLHKGDFDHGIEYLHKALAINPDAHFGREEYQVKLAEFLKRAASQPATQPDLEASGMPLAPENFLGVDFDAPPRGPYWREIGYSPIVDEGKVKSNAFDGIVGMLRFGTGQSAELYYVLGELLAAKGQTFLAYRAYQRAIEFHHPHAHVIEKFMEQLKARAMHQRALDDDVIADERAAAAQWVKEYQQYEDDLVRAGKDTDDDRNYADFYAHHSRDLPHRIFLQDYSPSENAETAVGLAGGGAVVLLVAFYIVRRRFRSRRVAPPLP